ncbi:MAG: hypothetical protein M3016_09570, partial [Actinomycetota bacterium]|nr:hypothetical protein [Actinomycetota bacterium]
LIVLAALVPCVLVPWRATTWPLAGAAIALGVAGVAGAWPAVAGRAGSAWRRAALGASGWIWLLLAGPLAGHGLYLNWLPGSPTAAWDGSLSATWTQVLVGLVRSGALAPAVVWAVAAAVLPWIVRGRSLAVDVAAVVVWSATVVSTATAAITLAHGSDGSPTAAGAVLGAVIGAIAALVPAWPQLWRGRVPSGSRGHFP